MSKNNEIKFHADILHSMWHSTKFGKKKKRHVLLGKKTNFGARKKNVSQALCVRRECGNVCVQIYFRCFLTFTNMFFITWADFGAVCSCAFSMNHTPNIGHAR